MSAPKPALEVELKNFGCPYAATDPRTQTWLEGFKAGFELAGDEARKILLARIK